MLLLLYSRSGSVLLLLYSRSGSVLLLPCGVEQRVMVGGGGRCLCVVILQWVFVCIIGGGAHSDKNARCGHTREEEGGQRWKDVCKREITEAGLKEGNTTNRAAWRNEIISYNGDPR